jgi:hypothetical protein
MSRENIWVGPFRDGKCVLCGANDLQGCMKNREVHWLMRGQGIEAAKRREMEERRKLAEGAASDDR